MSAASRLSAALLLCLGPALQAGEGSLAEQANDILTRHCHQCHGLAGSSKGGLAAILDRELLVARGLIVPGRPAESELYRKVKGGEMPPPSKKPRPEAGAANVLRDWIAAGAPALPGAPRTFVSPGDIVRLIRDDMQTFPARQRRFLRYVSFTHLHNAGRPVADLQLTDPALAKLVNSLSWHARITQPAAIDPAKTLFRLDLRDYRWTARTWERIVAVYPYRLPVVDPLGRECAEASGAEVFVVRGDWLLATASRGKLYYDLLELPASDRALERLLQVDVARDLQEETTLRAGFNGSGVSRNNRAIERHDAVHGALWRSHDFSDNSGRQNIFENPLGPVAGRHSFKPAGGEIIFNLPNGLQGYMLVDSTGGRVEKAPVEIVSDPLRPDKQVEAGLSCMTCHGRGLIPKDDQVRAHVEKNAAAFPAAVVESVRSLYPPARRLRTLLDADTKRYLTALEATGVPTEGPEPVSTLTLRYEGVADLASVAAELGLRPEEFTRKLSSSPSLLRLFGALQARAGTVQRPLLEEQFPRIVSLLGIGRQSVEKTAIVRKPEAETSFEGHTDAVRSLALSADGKLALSGSQDHTLRLWDTATGRLVRTFAGQDTVNCVAFSPDGTRILSAADDRTVRLWDISTGKELSCLRGHLDRVRAVVFAPDGKRALSAGQDRTLRLWDLQRGVEIRSFTGHTGAVLCVALAPDGKTAISGGVDGTLRLWDVETGREKEGRDAHRRGVLCVAFSADGKQAVSGGEDRTVRVWQVDGVRPLRSMTGHVNALLSVRFAEDGKRILSASSQTNREDRFLRVWDGASGEEIAGREGNASVWCAVFTSDGQYALTGGTDRRLQRWTVQASGR